MQPVMEGLRSGVVLAELGGYGDGPYCAIHGTGAALVMLGSYIVDAGDAVPYDPRFVFKPGRPHYAHYLQEHIAIARSGGAQVAVSVCTVTLEDTVDFLAAAQAAGADFVSYCAHSVMEMFLKANVSSALCRREHWPQLRRWAQTLVRSLSAPVIFKIGLDDTAETVGAVEVLAEAGVPVVHVNVEGTDPGSLGLAAIPQLKGQIPCLIVGGGITDIAGARRVLAAGADAVAVGTAAMGDPEFCRRLQEGLRERAM